MVINHQDLGTGDLGNRALVFSCNLLPPVPSGFAGKGSPRQPERCCNTFCQLPGQELGFAMRWLTGVPHSGSKRSPPSLPAPPASPQFRHWEGAPPPLTGHQRCWGRSGAAPVGARLSPQPSALPGTGAPTKDSPTRRQSPQAAVLPLKPSLAFCSTDTKYTKIKSVCTLDLEFSPRSY